MFASCPGCSSLPDGANDVKKKEKVRRPRLKPNKTKPVLPGKAGKAAKSMAASSTKVKGTGKGKHSASSAKGKGKSCSAKKNAAKPQLLTAEPEAVFLCSSRPGWPTEFTVASDCSGLCTEVPAARINFPEHVKVKHLYASELDLKKRKFIEEFVKPERLEANMENTSQLPALWFDVDLYTVGCPCQSWSLAGLKLGAQDPRGSLTALIPHQVDKHKPRSFVSENVKGLMTMFPKEFNWLVQSLRDIKLPNGALCYNVYFRKLDTQDFGLPQHRERAYIVGIRRDVQIQPFQWPMKFDVTLTLSQVLGPPAAGARKSLKETTHDANGVALNKTVRRNLLQFQDFLDKNPEKEDQDFIVDVGGSSATWMANKCPCLTASRCKGKHGYWSHLRQRFLTPEDMFRLQGVWPNAYGAGDQEALKRFPQTTLGEMVGNAMSVCVVRRLVRSILLARGILSQ